uniref:Uncharacterized protein n=1 Tax=Oryza sativa subsp. japonica TaxID=39947 RepID=Q67UJ8_ORYSJ|nr:hypothetical protein [Oryza sativa Japonica Group]BAD38171.1 hypothetical protein [Oryza sativa Japonica Group]
MGVEVKPFTMEGGGRRKPGAEADADAKAHTIGTAAASSSPTGRGFAPNPSQAAFWRALGEY